MFKTFIKTVTFSYALMAFFAGLASVSVSAQCGASLSALLNAASTRSSKSNVRSKLPNDLSGFEFGQSTSIVGMWHVQFLVETPDGDQPIQEAFQIWNLGGTEVHNPNVDPRSSAVCLGTWSSKNRVYNLTHRVWNWTADGVNQGMLHLSEAVSLFDQQNVMRGTFKIEVYDPMGTFLTEVSGKVVGERIKVGD